MYTCKTVHRTGSAPRNSRSVTPTTLPCPRRTSTQESVPIRLECGGPPRRHVPKGSRPRFPGLKDAIGVTPRCPSNVNPNRRPEEPVSVPQVHLPVALSMVHCLSRRGRLGSFFDALPGTSRGLHARMDGRGAWPVRHRLRGTIVSYLSVSSRNRRARGCRRVRIGSGHSKRR